MPARIPRPAVTGETAAFGALTHQPELAAAFFRLYGHLWSRGIVDQKTKETMRLRNARVTDCVFCKNVRLDGARREGLTEELVGMIDDGYASSTLSQRQKAALRLTDAFLAEPRPLDEETRRELVRHFSPAEIVELTAALALFLGFSKITVALGTAPESMATTVLPTPK